MGCFSKLEHIAHYETMTDQNTVKASFNEHTHTHTHARTHARTHAHAYAQSVG